MNGSASDQDFNKGPLTMALRQYICEFDPDSGPVDSAPCAQLSEAWNTYVQAFDDLCQVQNVGENDRKPLFLLLAGMKFRSRLDQIMSGSSNIPSLPEIFEAMANYFESKTSVQSLRYEFLYGLSSRSLPGEVPASWVKRLSEKARECEFEHMTSEEALALVMSKYGKVEAASRKRKAIMKNLQSQNKFARLMNHNEYGNSQEEAEDQEHHQQNVEDHLQVEMADWGEEEEEENVDQQTNDSYETSETSADIKPVLQQPNFGELIAEAVDYLPPSLKISSVKKTNKATHLTVVSPDEVTVPKGQPCNCPNCQESPTGKALRHKCHIENCGKEYAKTSHLRAHLGSHSAILPFACNWPGCGKRFYRTDQLTRHERTHTGEKRFVCFVCSRAFSRSDHLNKHAKRHTPEEIANATGGNGAEPKAAPWSTGNLPIPAHLLVGHK